MVEVSSVTCRLIVLIQISIVNSATNACDPMFDDSLRYYHDIEYQ